MLFFTLLIFSIFMTIHAQYHDRYDGVCSTPEGHRGECRNLISCPQVFDAITEGFETGIHYTPKRCGFDGLIPIVCCPTSISGDLTDPRPTVPDSGNTGSGVSAPTVHFDCGRRPPPKQFQNVLAVVGGIIAENVWPWMALLGRDTGIGEGNKYFCDGVLINEEWVLTAAHCVVDPRSFFVRLGEVDHSFVDPFDETSIDFKVGQIVTHPQYTGKDGYNDLALLHLTRTVAFRDEIKPVCLPWGEKAEENIIGKRVTLTGWGTITFGGPSSSVLREAVVTIFDPSTCEENYSTLPGYANSFPRGMTRDNIICAGDPSGGVDACQGDSGGPLVQEDGQTEKFTAVAIVSRGFACALQKFPGLYAPIAGNLEWIKQVAFTNTNRFATLI